MQSSAEMVSRRLDNARPAMLLDESTAGNVATGLDADLGPLLPGTVHVWAINVDKSIDTNLYVASLSAAELCRVQALRSGRDRQCLIARRGALRQLLGRYLAHEPADIEIDEGGGRKPALAAPRCEHGADKIRFNCSHSDGMALLAFTQDMAVGIDLERVRPMPEADDVALRFFSQHEYRALMDVPQRDRLAAFYECWTQKEAVIKALGQGFAMPLDSFTVSNVRGRRTQLTRLDGGNPGDWMLASLPLLSGYSSALAIRARLPVKIVTSWT